MRDRTAIDTIKGYFYQFDLSISELLNLPNDLGTIVVEGIEDIDVNSSEETAIQCKYFSKTEYNHSVIAKPIRLLLNNFNDVKNGKSTKIKYKLYCHFKSGHSKLSFPINCTFLKDNFLTYTEDKVKKYHHIDLGLNDSELDEFLDLLEIDINAKDYDEQLNEIYRLLKQQFADCSEFDAENFYYNNAIKLIKNLAVTPDISNRKITKIDFLTQINIKAHFFNDWFLKFKGEKLLFNELRTQYFSALNISSFERFFLIETPSVGYSRPTIKELLHTISKKWSKNSSREPKPVCPYIYFCNIPINELIALKSELQSEGFTVIDGFDFFGATFNPASVARSIKGTDIKLKILNQADYLESTFAEISKTKEIYQFFFNEPFFTKEFQNIKHVKIKINNIENIRKII